MPNMSYCRFQNTYGDLIDCSHHMNEHLSESETKYKEYLVELCREIIEEYELQHVRDTVWGDDAWENNNTTESE